MDLFRLLLLGSADLRQSAAAPMPKSYLAAVVSDQGARLIAVVAGLWLAPLALGYLGRDAYGLFALTMSVIAWLNVIDLGTPAGLQVHLTHVAANGNSEEASRYVSSAFMAQLVMSAVLLAVGVLRDRRLRPLFSRAAGVGLRDRVSGGLPAAGDGPQADGSD